MYVCCWFCWCCNFCWCCCCCSCRNFRINILHLWVYYVAATWCSRFMQNFSKQKKKLRKTMNIANVFLRHVNVCAYFGTIFLTQHSKKNWWILILKYVEIILQRLDNIQSQLNCYLNYFLINWWLYGGLMWESMYILCRLETRVFKSRHWKP